MPKVVLLNKPYDVLCQFTDGEGRATLADFITDPALKKVYPAGRLDRDSEGLVVLTDNGALQHHIAHPQKKQPKRYWAQVEGDITSQALSLLQKGVALKDGITKPALAKRIQTPDIWPRSKPVRFRANIPTSWIELAISEGRNRQVRRMTAAVGFPTLRLIRVSVSEWDLFSKGELVLAPGEYSVIDVNTPIKHSKSGQNIRQQKRPLIQKARSKNRKKH